LNYILAIEIKEIFIFLLGTAVHNLFPSYLILPAGIERGHSSHTNQMK